jgi:hypothetical protein
LCQVFDNIALPLKEREVLEEIKKKLLEIDLWRTRIPPRFWGNSVRVCEFLNKDSPERARFFNGLRDVEHISQTLTKGKPLITEGRIAAAVDIDIPRLIRKVHSIKSDTRSTSGYYTEVEIRTFAKVTEWIASEHDGSLTSEEIYIDRPQLRGFLSTLFESQSGSAIETFHQYDIGEESKKADFTYLLHLVVNLYFEQKQKVWRQFGYEYVCCPNTGQLIVITKIDRAVESDSANSDSGSDNEENDQGVLKRANLGPE